MGNYFSKNLKFLREKRNLSQNKLAEMIGVNQTTVARWEDDNRTPNLDNAIDVSVTLNIPLADLIGKDLSILDNSVLPSSETDGKRILKEKGIMDENDNINIEKLNEFNKKIAVLDEFSNLVEKLNKTKEQ